MLIEVPIKISKQINEKIIFCLNYSFISSNTNSQVTLVLKVENKIDCYQRTCPSICLATVLGKGCIPSVMGLSVSYLELSVINNGSPNHSGSLMNTQ